MNPKIWIFSSFFLFVLLITSCRDEVNSAGSKWLTSSFNNVQTDTCTVQLSTILADSVATSGDTLCQLGHYNSSTWGDIESSFYAEYNVTSTSLTNGITYQFDSITITLKPTGDYVGDTLSTPQHIYMHRLKKNISFDDAGYLYNRSSIPYESDALATLTFKNKPKIKKKLELRLPDEFGEELFTLMKNRSISVSSQEYFRNYLKGIAFVPDGDDDCISGFAVNDSSLCMTVYYRRMASSPVNLKATFTPSSTLTFGRIVHDLNNTPLADLEPGTSNALSSTKSSNQAFIQGMTGMYTKIEFPYLNDLRTQGDIVTIESAILYLYPVQGTYGTTMPLPSALTMYTANSKNISQESITDSYGTSVQDGSLVTDKASYNGTYYTFDLTSFLQTNLGTFGDNRQKLMLMLPNSAFLTTLDGVTFGDTDHKTSRVKLAVIYKTYNEQ
ncbi:MAG: hypothetical protein H6Q13_2426 [Bacteroidetes bacterium]|nr:hypothetical protein [Bacteroidota bacterium]